MVVFVGALCFAGTVFAAAEKVSRPCTKADLVGVWNMKSVQPPQNPGDPIFYKHQRFVFSEDSSMKFMTSEKSFTQEWLDKFEQQPREIDYSVDPKGLVTLTWQNKPYHETALCAYVMQEVPPEVVSKIPEADRSVIPQKGNISLSFLAGGKIAYRKILEK